ncbi:MAG: hypothetical protein A3F95_00090 [Candidatus Nealsonbacteria bacterium RIFCSPLOWO2_12_FULL_39_31]|uniref:Leucine-binding protein domain-containing protein n=1 Tax=Candidatus Nealsonbacteria bacterium RIFCSPLOWO2_12_FULL_39_31 TaxID=1801676 RepID=A0A1G2ELV7_9BACT|nr:MAG: hypothetical protein A3F95_00090 [Candidatus Nealsonbacteria bacterium RIFCSPLOWO2_12_FULL_39_31]
MKKIIIGIAVIILIVVGISYFGKNSSQPSVKEPIKIGVILPLTGDASFIGEAAKNSAILAKESFGKTKNTYELVFEDDQADSKKTVSAFRKLVDIDKIRAVGTGFAGPGNAVASLAEQEKIIHFSIASDLNIAKDKPFVFNHWIKPENEAGVYIKEAKKQGLKKIAMIATNQQGIIAIRDALLKEEPDLFILKDELFNPQEKDFRTAVIKAKNEGADAFIMMLLPGQLTSLVKQIKDLNINVPLTSVESFEYDLEAVPMLEGQWYVTSADPSEEFTASYKEKYNGLPQPGSAYAYDVIRILITAFEKEKTNEGVAKFISEIKDFLGVTGVLSVDSDGNINSKAVIKKIINGKFVEVK